MLEAGTEMMLSEEVLVSWQRRGQKETEISSVNGKTLPEATVTVRRPQNAGSHDGGKNS